MESTKRSLPRSRSETRRPCNGPTAEPAPFSPNLGRAPSARSKSATKSRAASESDALRRRPKENRESPSPRPPAPDPPRRPRTAAASAWALSPGRPQSAPPPPPPAKAVKRRAGGVLGFFRQRKEPSAREEAAHQLRLLTSRVLQWRFVNARAESAMAAARASAEQKIFYTWLRINELRNIVAAKQIICQRRKLKMKLARILNPQFQFLVQWESSAKRHLENVAALARVLGAMCLSLPLIDGAQANMVSIYNYFYIAMDIIREIEAKIGIFYSKVEKISLLLCETANTMRHEIESLQDLVKTSKTITSLEMHEISLRADLIQVTKEGIYIDCQKVH